MTTEKEFGWPWDEEPYLGSRYVHKWAARRNAAEHVHQTLLKLLNEKRRSVGYGDSSSVDYLLALECEVGRAKAVAEIANQKWAFCMMETTAEATR